MPKRSREIEYIEGLYKKDLNEPDYDKGVICHPKPDILECKVKWALRSTAVNKARGYDEIPAELFKSLKDDAIKVLHSLCQKIWMTQQWPQDWKMPIFIQFPRRVVLKNVLTIRQLHSSPMLVRSCLKSCMLGFSIIQTRNFQMSKMGIEKEEELEIKLQTFAGLIEKAMEFQKNTSLCFIDYTEAFESGS